MPKDIEAPYAPVSIAVGGNDKIFTVKMGERTRETWKKKAEFSKFEMVVYEGGEHGFAVRGNMNNPKEREQQEKAIDQVSISAHPALVLQSILVILTYIGCRLVCSVFVVRHPNWTLRCISQFPVVMEFGCFVPFCRVLVQTGHFIVITSFLSM